MTRIPFRLANILLAIVLLHPVAAQDIEKIVIPDSAAKYYRILQKSPSRSYLYDRFLDAWLKERPLSELPQFFIQEANATEATATEQLLAGFYFSRKGDVPEALQWFEKAIKLDPANTEARIQRAKLFARELSFDLAVTELDAAITSENVDPKQGLEMGKLKGRYLARTGKSDEALTVWQALLEAHPEDLFLHEDVVESLASEGLLEEAIRYAESLVEKEKEPYEQLIRTFRVAELAVLNEESDRAVKIYEGILPKTGAGNWLEREIIARVGSIYRRSDEIDTLSQWIEQEVSKYPNRMELLQYQALLAIEIGEPEKAVELYETILEKSPGDRSVEDAYVDVLAKMDRVDDAISQQKTVIEQNPEDAQALLRLAELHAVAKKPNAAGDAVEAAFELTAKAEIDYLRSTKFLQKFELFERAEKLLKSGRTAHPESSEIPETLGSLFLREKKPEEAVALFEELAGQGSVDQILRLAKALTRENIAAEALAILNSRKTDFSEEFTWVEAVIQISVQLDLREELEELTLSHLLLADSPETLDRALMLATSSFSKSEHRSPLLEKLKAKSDPLPVEISLTAQLLSREGEIAEAIDLLDDATSKYEGDDRVLLLRQQSLIFRRDKDWENAARIAEVIYLDAGGKTSRNIKELIGILELAGREEDALSRIVEWKTLSPGSVIPWMREADMLYTLDRGDDAIATMRKAASQFPDATEIQLKLAQLHDDLNDPAEAARIYWDLYEETEESTIRLRRVSDLYELASYGNTVSDLIEEFQQRRQSNRTSADPLLALARIYELDARTREQESSLIEASQLRPDDLALLHQIADVQLKDDEWEKSIATLGTAARMDKTPRSRQRIARIEIEFGDPEKGYQQLTELALELSDADNSLAVLVEEIADVMIRNGDAEIAANYLAEYFDEFPDNYRLRYLRGVALEMDGSYTDAAVAFLELLDQKTEMNVPLLATLTEVEKKTIEEKKAKSEKAMNRLPDEVASIMLLLSSKRREAYFHTSTNNAVPGDGIASLENRFVLPPIDLEALQQYTKLHLAGVYRDTDDAPTRESIEQRFTGSESGSSDLLLKLESSDNYGAVAVTAEILRERKTDVALQLLWLRTVTYLVPDAEIESEDFLQVRSNLRATYPEYSALPAFLGAHYCEKEDFSEAIAESIEDMKTMDMSDPIVRQSLAAAIGILPYNAEVDPITPEQFEKIFPIVKRAAAEPSDLDQYSQIFRGLIVAEQFRTKDYEKLAATLEKQITEKRENNNFHANSQYFYFPMIQGFVGASEYLPATIAYLASKTPNTPATYPYHRPDETEISALLGHVSNPTLSLILTMSLGDEEKTKELLKKQTADDTHSVDQLLLFARWAYDQKDLDVMVTHLKKARRLTALDSTRQKIDGLTAWASAQNKGKSEELDKEAKRALTKIAALNPPQQYRYQLQSYMQQHGMTDELAKLTKTSRQRSTASSVVSGATKQASQKIKDLVAKGKRDAAIKLAAREARTVGREAAKQSYGNWRNNFWELRSALNETGIAIPALKAVAKANGNTSENRIYETGIAAELFEQTLFAQKEYLRILDLDPEHIGALSRLTWIESETKGAESATTRLKSVPLELLPKLLAKVSSQVHGVGYDTPESTATFNTVAASLSMLSRFPKDSDSNDLTWIDALFQSLISERDWGGVEVAFIHDQAPFFSDRNRSSNQEPSEAADQVREKAYLEFCELGKDFPALARSVFITASAYDLQRGGERKKWLARAKELITDEENSRRTIESVGNYDNDCYPLYTPEEFLIVEAAKNKDNSAAEAIIESSSEKYNEWLKAFRDLHFDSLDNFAANSKALNEAQSSSPLQSAIASQYHIAWAAISRKAPYDAMKSQLKEFIHEGENGRSFVQSQQVWYRTWMNAQAKTEGYPGHRVALQSLRGSCLGVDIEKVRERIADAYKSSGGGQLSWNTDEGRFGYSVMGTLAKEEAYLFPATTVMTDVGYKLDRFFDQIWKYRAGDYFSSRKNLEKFIPAADWFGPVSEIDFLPATSFRDTGSLFAQFVKEANSGIKKEDLLAVIKDQPDSFFKEFAILLVSQKGNARVTPGLTLIGDYLDEFKDLDAEQRTRWLEVFANLGIGLALDKPEEGDTSSVALASGWLLEQGAKSAEAEISDFLASNQVSDTGLGEKAFENRLTSLMRRVIDTDHRKAADIFLHGWQLIKKEQRGAGWRGTSSSNGWPVSSELLETYLEKNQIGLSDIAFFVEVQKRDKKGETCHSGWHHEFAFNNRMKKYLESHGGLGNPDKAVAAMLKELHQLIGEDPENYSNILSLPFHKLIQDLPKPQRKSIILAADKVAEANLPESKLATIMAMAGRFLLNAGPDERVAKDERQSVPNPENWKPFAIAQLTDETKTGSFLAPLASLYCVYGPENGDDDIAMIAGKILANALENEEAFNGYNLFRCLRTFCPRQGNPEWDETAQRILAGWWKKNRHNDESRYKGRAFDPPTEIIMSAIELSARIGGDDSVSRFRKEFATSVYGSRFSRLPLLLVLHGQDEQALNIIKDHSAKYDGSKYYTDARYFLVRLKPDLMPRVDEFLASIEDPELAILSKALLYSAPDFPAKDLPQGWTRRTGRLHGVAEQFQKATWTDPKLKQRAMQMILSDTALAPRLYKEIEIASKEIDPLETIASNDYITIEYGIRIPAANASYRALHGDLKPLGKLWSEIDASNSKYYYTNEAREEVARFIWDLIRKRGLTLDPKDLKPLIEACQLMLVDYKQKTTHYTDHDALVCAWVAAASLAGETAEARKWFNSLPLAQRTELRKSMNGHHGAVLVTLTNALKTWINHENSTPELRKRFVTEYFANPTIQSAFTRARPLKEKLFEEVIKKKALSEDEVFEIAEDLHKAWPREGIAAFELSKLASKAGKTELAIKWGATAIKEFEKAAETRRIDAVIFHAEILAEDGQTDKATAALAMLPRDPRQKEQPAHVKRLNELKKKL